MKILQDDFEKIKKITGKEYDDIHVQYSNNGEDEYVMIYSEIIIEEIISDLLEVIENGNLY